MLDERARRLLLGAGARQLGRGGITAIAAPTGVSKRGLQGLIGSDVLSRFEYVVVDYDRRLGLPPV